MSQCPHYPLTRQNPLLPPEEFAEWRKSSPIRQVKLWNDSLAWVVTRFKETREVLLNPAFSESPKSEGYPMFSPARGALVSNNVEITHTRGLEHARFRKVLAKELTFKRVKAMEPLVREVAERLLDDILKSKGPIDLVSSFALKLPMTVITKALSVPFEDSDFFESRTISRIRLDADEDEPLRATNEMRAYFRTLLLDRQNGTGDDLITRLARDHLATGEITLEEAETLAYTLVQGGHETTANGIALGALLLMLHPDQKATTFADEGRIDFAVEEILRFTTILQFGMTRVATQDTTVGGCPVKKGEGVFVSLLSANHDEQAFERPEHFNVARDQRNHVAFSFGAHQCMGQHLARLELREALRALFARIPSLQLAIPFEDIKFKNSAVVYGVESLPVKW